MQHGKLAADRAETTAPEKAGLSLGVDEHLAQPFERSTEFRVLCVCTANLCRSPMAEHVMRASARSFGLDWSIRSAGVNARDGQSMHPRAQAVLDDRDIDVDGWVSHRLEQSMVLRADLILTATAEQRALTARLDPTASSRSFTLLQFARYAAASQRSAGSQHTGSSLEQLQRIAQVRGTLPMSATGHDLFDPIGRPPRAFRKCAALIDEAVAHIVPAMRTD